MGKRARRGPKRSVPSPVELLEFAAPVEDPECPVCRMPEAARMLAMLHARDFGDINVIDSDGHVHRFDHIAEGTGGMSEMLAFMRERAKERSDTS